MRFSFVSLRDWKKKNKYLLYVFILYIYVMLGFIRWITMKTRKKSSFISVGFFLLWKLNSSLFVSEKSLKFWSQFRLPMRASKEERAGIRRCIFNNMKLDCFFCTFFCDCFSSNIHFKWRLIIQFLPNAESAFTPFWNHKFIRLDKNSSHLSNFKVYWNNCVV